MKLYCSFRSIPPFIDQSEHGRDVTVRRTIAQKVAMEGIGEVKKAVLHASEGSGIENIYRFFSTIEDAMRGNSGMIISIDVPIKLADGVKEVPISGIDLQNHRKEWNLSIGEAPKEQAPEQHEEVTRSLRAMMGPVR